MQVGRCRGPRVDNATLHRLAMTADLQVFSGAPHSVRQTKKQKIDLGMVWGFLHGDGILSWRL